MGTHQSNNMMHLSGLGRHDFLSGRPPMMMNQRPMPGGLQLDLDRIRSQQHSEQAAKENTLADQRFMRWVFGDEQRISLLKEQLLGTPQDARCFNIVLTNGCAPHVQQALDYVGLSPAFSSIVDTGGIAMIDGKETKVALGARYNKGEYVQRVLMPKHMPTGRAHVIYVDDSIEFRSVPAHLGSCDVVELKREGLGLDKELFDTVNDLRENALAKEAASVCVVYDFDCTLSMKHMWKAMHQPNSQWASEWARYKTAANAA